MHSVPAFYCNINYCIENSILAGLLWYEKRLVYFIQNNGLHVLYLVFNIMNKPTNNATFTQLVISVYIYYLKARNTVYSTASSIL